MGMFTDLLLIVIVSACIVGLPSTIGILKKAEWNCEAQHNVYDCEMIFIPVEQKE